MFDLFKKKKAPIIEEDSSVISKEMFLKTMKEFAEYTIKDVINIELGDENCTLFDSKFGGLPYLGPEDDVPLSSENKPLRMLGQIRLAELPANNYFEKHGLLQFWILDNDLYGLDFDDMTSQKESRVIYYPIMDKEVTEDQIRAKYHPDEDAYFPINDTFRLHFTRSSEGMSIGDYHFDTLFPQVWNRLNPKFMIESFYDLPDDLIDEDEFNKYSGFGHKMFGFPGFTQEDPRDDNNYDDYVLLLQIDSVGLGDKEIMWGDSGICNFFITKKDLEADDFTKVLYNWDCY